MHRYVALQLHTCSLCITSYLVGNNGVCEQLEVLRDIMPMMVQGTSFGGRPICYVVH